MATVDVMRTLLTRLIDDAGVFPPARLPMPKALAAHRDELGGPDAWMIGRFLSPASRLEEFSLAAGRSRPELGVVIDTLGADPAIGDVANACVVAAKYEPTSVEMLTSAEEPLMASVGVVLDGFAELPDRTPAYVELPRGDAVAEWPRAIGAIGAARAGGRAVGAKIRCAGVDQRHVPTDQELARFIVACRDGLAPFKATAGLHQAIRAQHDDGIDRHGVLNLLLACATALRDGSSEAAVAAVLAERDAAVVVDGVCGITPEEAARVRAELLVGFGCCSPAEPIAQIRALGLLGAVGV